MDSFINAVNRVQSKAATKPAAERTVSPPQQPISTLDWPKVELSSAQLKANRIVAQDIHDGLSRPFDVMRNICLPDVPADVRVIGVTSPNEGCGVTTTAINLALSLARLDKGAVVFTDLSKGAVRARKLLGLPFDAHSVQTRFEATVLGHSLYYVDAAQTIERTGMAAWRRDIARSFGAVTIVVDLPPLLTDDSAAAVLPDVDLVLLLLAVGHSRVQELENCKSYLTHGNKIKVVLNKTRDYDA